MIIIRHSLTTAYPTIRSYRIVASQSTQNSLNSFNTVIIAIFQRIYAVEHDDGVINIRIASPLITAIGFGSLVAAYWLILGFALSVVAA